MTTDDEMTAWFLDTQEATGSSPVGPTKESPRSTNGSILANEVSRLQTMKLLVPSCVRSSTAGTSPGIWKSIRSFPVPLAVKGTNDPGGIGGGVHPPGNVLLADRRRQRGDRHLRQSQVHSPGRHPSMNPETRPTISFLVSAPRAAPSGVHGDTVMSWRAFCWTV